MSSKLRRCKDCDPNLKVPRLATYPGPRCATHHRAHRKASAERSHDRMVQRVYGLPPGAYEALKASQGGVCAGCGPRTGRSGKSRRLAVDHDHTTGEVRGLLCSECNRMVGRLRDDPTTFQRLADYLRDPPARWVLHRD